MLQSRGLLALGSLKPSAEEVLVMERSAEVVEMELSEVVVDVAAVATNVVVTEEEGEVTETEEETVGTVHKASGSLGCGQVVCLAESGQNSRILL